MIQFKVPENSGTLFAEDAEQHLGIPAGSSYILGNGRLISRSTPLVQGHIYQIVPRVLGGKGGFGSMLRAIGAQIEKTTSREACRDLSGRRIRDVNNEKKLKEWVSKQIDREREKEERDERRRAKRAKYLSPEDTPGRMDNPEFTEQSSLIKEKSEKAIQEGLAKMKSGSTASGSRKRKADTLDKYDRWSIVGGVNLEDMDGATSSEEESSGSNDGAGPSTSGACYASHSSSSSSPSQSAAGTSRPKASATLTSADLEASCSSSDMSANATAVSGHSDSAEAGAAACGVSGSQIEAAVTSSPDNADASPCKMARMEDSAARSSQVTEKQAKDSSDADQPIDLEDYSCAEDLHALGMEHLKADLMRRGLKCGGSLQERAHRLFSVKGLAPDDIPAKLLAKGQGQGKTSK